MSTEQAKKMNRNPIGKGGFKEHPNNINPGGRPKNSLKSYVARMFAEMSDEAKKKWLKDNKINGIDQWKMGEGNPEQNSNIQGALTISEVLDNLENDGQTPQGQELENK